MRRSTFLLCAAAIGLAACGSDDAEDAANAAANAANTAANTADTTVTDAGNAAANATNAAGNATGGVSGKGKGGTFKLAPRKAVKVEFQGCPRIVNVSKPSGCLVVKSGSETYEIDSARPRPAPGQLIITGSGVYNPNVKGICMAGKHLTKVTWRPTKAKCSSAKGG